MKNLLAFSGIRDNHTRGKVADFLLAKISAGSRLSIVSAYFTIYAYQWFGQFLFSSSSGGLMELSENSALRAATIGQAKSTGYFMKLRDWPEFDLIRPAGANRLIVGFKTVRTIGLSGAG